ncbi:hypothetical protein ACFE04_005949 [Oxalis oulophora]
MMMLSKHNTYKLQLLSRFISQNPLKTKPFYHFFSNSKHYCDIDSTESHELPSWLKKSPTDSNEDFVIPSLANWVVNNQTKDVQPFIIHKEENVHVTAIDKITEILKKRYDSWRDVVHALNGHPLTPSNTLISELLLRFGNVWVPAFGVFTWAKNQTGYVHTLELYNKMVDILGKYKKFDLMWGLVNEMNKVDEGLVTLDTMTIVMRRLAKACRYDDAIDSFKGIEQFNVRKSTEALKILIDALVKGDSVEHAYRVFVEFKDSIPAGISEFNILIHGYCRARKFDDARKIFYLMETCGLRPDVVSYTCFIEAYSRERDFRKVDAIFDEMKEMSCKPNVISYTIVMNALGKAQQINEALGVYEKMKSNGCVPDTPFVSALVFLLSKSGRLKDATEIFEDIENQGLKPDVLLYNTMISSFCAHWQEEKALTLLKKMVEVDLCKPDLGTYGPILKLCCRNKRIKLLHFVLNHMYKNSVPVDLEVYTMLVRGLYRNDKIELACSFFEAIVAEGMVPKDNTYKMLVEGLETKGMSTMKERIQKLMMKAKGGFSE